MKTSRAVILALVLAAALALIFFFSKSNPFTPHVRPSSIGGGVYTGAPLKNAYRNDTYQFKLSMPDGFSAGELPPDENGGTAVLLQNEQGEGIQIYVVPAQDEKVLTADDIRTAIPGMEVSSPEAVEIGSEYVGAAFISDNQAFEGRSREVWFYYKGNLYQISTYARLDTLLKAMFATWEFF